MNSKKHLIKYLQVNMDSKKNLKVQFTIVNHNLRWTNSILMILTN